jgi:hypothetical protein
VIGFNSLGRLAIGQAEDGYAGALASVESSDVASFVGALYNSSHTASNSTVQVIPLKVMTPKANIVVTSKSTLHERLVAAGVVSLYDTSSIVSKGRNLFHPTVNINDFSIVPVIPHKVIAEIVTITSQSGLTSFRNYISRPLINTRSVSSVTQNSYRVLAGAVDVSSKGSSSTSGKDRAFGSSAILSYGSFSINTHGRFGTGASANSLSNLILHPIKVIRDTVLPINVSSDISISAERLVGDIYIFARSFSNVTTSWIYTAGASFLINGITNIQTDSNRLRPATSTSFSQSSSTSIAKGRKFGRPSIYPTTFVGVTASALKYGAITARGISSVFTLQSRIARSKILIDSESAVNVTYHLTRTVSSDSSSSSRVFVFSRARFFLRPTIYSYSNVTLDQHLTRNAISRTRTISSVVSYDSVIRRSKSTIYSQSEIISGQNRLRSASCSITAGSEILSNCIRVRWDFSTISSKSVISSRAARKAIGVASGYSSSVISISPHKFLRAVTSIRSISQPSIIGSGIFQTKAVISSKSKVDLDIVRIYLNFAEIESYSSVKVKAALLPMYDSPHILVGV